MGNWGAAGRVASGMAVAGGGAVGATKVAGRAVGTGVTVGSIGSALVGARVGAGIVAAATINGSGDGAAPVDGSVVPQPASRKNCNSAGRDKRIKQRRLNR